MPQSTFLAWITRMSLIQRWGLMHCIQPENVSEHSHQVAVIAHMLAIIRNKKFGGQLIPEKAATLALYHEVSETKLQDVNSKTKYHNPEFTRQFKLLEALAEQECLETLPEEFRDDFADLVIQKEVDPEYQPLIKAADILSAYIKTNNELRFGNNEFTHVKPNLEQKLAQFAEQLPEVGYFMETFAESCTATLDKLTGQDA